MKIARFRIKVLHFLVLCTIFLLTCEIALRIRLAYSAKELGWLIYHQFKLRTPQEIFEALPQYYRKYMFKPYSLAFKYEKPLKKKRIITIESSVLRSIRKQLVKLLEHDEQFEWREYSPEVSKVITLSNNDVILYEFYVYPDIFNVLKKESRIFKKILGESLDDFLYNNFVLYLHLDEKINFLSINKDAILESYLKSLLAREEPLFRQISDENIKNFICIITPHRFNTATRAAKVYAYYLSSAYEAMVNLLKKYNITYIDFFHTELENDDFKDNFHFSAKGGMKLAKEIIVFLQSYPRKKE